LADITYIATLEGWLYLAAILDLYTRRIVGWAMSDRMTSDLTIAALEMALLQRQPDAGLIHHSDQGSQYTDQAYQALLKDHGIRASMNGAGSWYDNAPMQSFFGTLKSELVHHCVYHARDEAKADVFFYIESFYNRRRRHSALDYLSPEAFLLATSADLCLTPCPQNWGRVSRRNVPLSSQVPGDLDCRRLARMVPDRFRPDFMPTALKTEHGTRWRPGAALVSERGAAAVAAEKEVLCFLVGFNGGEDGPADGCHPDANSHTTQRAQHARNDKHRRIHTAFRKLLHLLGVHAWNPSPTRYLSDHNDGADHARDQPTNQSSNGPGPGPLTRSARRYQEEPGECPDASIYQQAYPTTDPGEDLRYWQQYELIQQRHHHQDNYTNQPCFQSRFSSHD